LVRVVVFVMPLVVEVAHELRGSVLDGQVVAVHQLTYRLSQGPVWKVIVGARVYVCSHAYRRLPGVPLVGLFSTRTGSRELRSGPRSDRASYTLTGGGPIGLSSPSAAIKPLASRSLGVGTPSAVLVTPAVRDDAFGKPAGTVSSPERIRNKRIVPVRGAKDGEGIQHLVGATDQGKSYALAPNELNDSELAGPAFSPTAACCSPASNRRATSSRSLVLGAAQQRPQLM
jgi:hypothetical protein